MASVSLATQNTFRNNGNHEIYCVAV
jgi:hypothetical protein